ncbi:F-box/kelch-repeat protein At3g06240-like [Papaver somniferum]|uniref:F-box/kelch-repeat protein At3g06240-like n=1 Tax=Papaver somniferum TaxID=3469 RepID=UPI000E705FD0|nr:F-box/kelch-repeat protein At3g06240-like [Papaver somniferum]
MAIIPEVSNKKSKEMTILPEEIKTDILSRLPVKSLMRFKSVCKPWRCLFRDPGFAKMHREHATRNGTSTFLMLHYRFTRFAMDAFYSIDHTSLSIQLLSPLRDEALHDSTAMHYPLIPPNHLEVLGSCNGLVCLRTSVPGDEDAICLWNPSTREYKNLPASPNRFRSSNVDMDIVVCGLGYDDENNDFKVVRLAEINSTDDSFDDSGDWSEMEVHTIRPGSDHEVEASIKRSQSVFEIYSLRSDAWKKCQTVPYYFPGYLKPGVIVNGALHWWAMKRHGDGDEVILSFDFNEEVFKEVAILEGPMIHKEVSDTDYENNSVGVLGGCLCLLHKTFDKVDVWIMQEYGVKESWTKRFTITEESIVDTIALRVICDFQNGAILFSTDDSLVYYDPSPERGTRKLRILGTDDLEGAEKCISSIVSLNSGTYC